MTTFLRSFWTFNSGVTGAVELLTEQNVLTILDNDCEEVKKISVTPCY